MIKILATRYQKRVAFFLCIVIYFQLGLPSIVRAIDNDKHYPLRIDASAKKPNHIPWLGVGENRIAKKATHESNTLIKTSPTIGGPGQPEMSSFKSVNADNMVDLFTGDFSYNIPLMEVGGYPVNIHYSSNISMDQEASWVGLGWNINPGSINRSMRGLPDDFNGKDTIGKIQSIRENRTVGLNVSPDIEVTGLPINLSVTAGIFHNSYNGWGIQTGVNASISAGNASFGPLSGGLSLSNNSQTGLDVSPSIKVRLADFSNYQNARVVNLGLSTNYNSRAGISGLQLNLEYRQIKQRALYQYGDEGASGGGTSYPNAGISFAIPSYAPSITMPITNTQFAFRGKVGGEQFVVHPSSLAVEGYVSSQEIRGKDTLQKVPAVGYLHYTKSVNNSNTLLDFNREKELTFNYKTTPHIAIPQYTYDVYSISGEGTGGMFRPYRGDIGYMRDYTVRTKSESSRGSIDLGFGNIFHGGVDYSITNSYTENNGWNIKNDLRKHIQFQNSDTTFQAVYFRNPGEMTTNAQNYYQAIGDDALMRVKLTGDRANIKAANIFTTLKNGRLAGEIPFTTTVTKKERDKRSQVISYLNAEEASLYGLQRSIISYKENSIPLGNCNDTFTVVPRVDPMIRKPHHISEITVLGNDGRRYVYGIPAYNLVQKDVTFSIEKEEDQADLTKGLADYQVNWDNTTKNNKGKESLYTKDSMPAYAHSFLLSGIVSSDYVDIKGDGISEDDIGDAIKFNYSRIYGSEGDEFEWRTPFQYGKANYNEGFKSYKRDDKGTYLHGKKEVWYLNSIESKTMIAVFTLKNDRKDIYSISGENGGLNTSRSLRRLEKIDLYVKADLIKNGVNARPVKTAHFAHSYKLCKGVVGDLTIGKLTLDSIWFTYNGNKKGKQNPYVFKYNHNSTDDNPNYNSTYYDRWGNFKNPITNPGSLKNADYPYAEQQKHHADKYAAVWALKEIKLPSGATMKMSYEADDYGYVQNKRATQFFQITGVSKDLNSTIGNTLYSYKKITDTYEDFNYVFVNSSSPLLSKKEIFEKFLEGNEYIYLKLFVKVPDDRWGTGNEFVPVYARVEDYGIVPGNSSRFYIKLRTVEGDGALARSAIQFLRLNLPSKAYPTSEVGNNPSFLDAIKMLVSSVSEIRNAVRGFGKEARRKDWCNQIDLSRSFVRLNAPEYRKFGGGLRIKKIEVFNNWNQMTNQREAIYGQEYNYTTTIKVNGQEKKISSGVASYEPMIGAEENPFRSPIPYVEKIAPLAPSSNLFSEYPLGEAYFPSANVGYSKVRVRTINTKAKSANGWRETEFYTTKDFPTLVEHSLLDEHSKKRHNPALQNLLRINAMNHVYLSQGFKIELNDMNGKVKVQASYSEKDSLRPISFLQNFYKVENSSALQKKLSNTVWAVDSLNGHINPTAIIGKDIEVMMDLREQTSKTIAVNKSANIEIIPGFGIFPFIPLPTLIPLPQKEEVIFRSAATVKIVHRYGILDSVVVMDKGSVVSTKNLVYDSETGEVVLSRTNNEFDDPIYNFSYPAHWAYSGMGMAYRNVDALFTNLNLVNGKLYYRNNHTAYPVEKFFESGDEIQLVGIKKTVDSTPNCLDFVIQSGTPGDDEYLPNKAWVIEAKKGMKGDRGLFFIDSTGKPLSGNVTKMRILRSGKRNLLNASVGSIVSLANPIREVAPGNFRFIFDSLSRVINTSAVTYKDQWKVENSFYLLDSCATVIRDTTVTLGLKEAVLARLKRFPTWSTDLINQQDRNPPPQWLTASWDFVRNDNNFHGLDYRTKALLHFDFANLPFYNNLQTVTGAQFKYKLKAPTNLWNRESYRFRCGGTFLNPIYCERHSHNWPAETRYAGGIYSSALKRVQGPWDGSTKYWSFNTTTSNQALVSSLPPSGNLHQVNCTNLIKDIVENRKPYFGLMFELSTNVNPYQDNPHFYSLDGCSSAQLNTKGNSAIIPGCQAQISIEVTYTYRKDTCYKICRKEISDSVVNPYRWGILGNWRTDRAYTFYYDRKESDANLTVTNIRKEGQLKDFATFWKFTDSVLLELPDTTKWIWNSASSQYNKKGFEIENYDPLGRYNAALYGYNQTLPIAVAQNARYKEILFDGFEDYHYKTRICDTCRTPREYDFVKENSSASIIDSVSHTGRYALRVHQGSEASIIAPITTVSMDTIRSGLYIDVDTTTITSDTVLGTGQGLSGYYTGYSSQFMCPRNYTGPPTFLDSVIQGPIDFYWGNNAPRSGMCNTLYTVSWKGKIQAPETDNYQFYAYSGGSMTITINRVAVAVATRPYMESGGNVSVFMEKGKLYDVEVRYDHFRGREAFARMRWTRHNNPFVEIVPQRLLYKNYMMPSDSAGSVVGSILYHCIQLDSLEPRNIIRKTFSPYENSKIVVSGWVRTDDANCDMLPAPENVLAVQFTNIWGNTSHVNLLKTGVRIEGWQRYEAVITVPAYSKEIKLRAVAPSNSNIFVDDVRVQPFNSHLKSYVYDPINLRVMAELDENNYAAFYEYDDDGTLIRVKKETERGIMTIKETRSALLKQ